MTALSGDTILSMFAEKYGYEGIVKEQLVATPNKTLREYLAEAESLGLEEIIPDMPLSQLFGVTQSTYKSSASVLRQKVIDALKDNAKYCTKRKIATMVGENGPHLSTALATLKRNGTLKVKGEKRNTKYKLVKNGKKTKTIRRKRKPDAAPPAPDAAEEVTQEPEET